MSEPQTITPDHVLSLLAARSDAARIGLLEGLVVVDDTVEGSADGLLEVVTRADLVARLGTDPDEEAVRAEADALTVAVQQAGG
mgnify:CR=1 FL=1